MPSSLCHFEIMTPDPEACQAFFAAVLGWEFDNDSLPGYTLVSTGREPTGGIFLKPESAPRACANMYFNVDNIDDTLQKAVDHGATVLVPRTEVPGIGFLGMFAGPDGVPIGIMQAG